jgi:hypothetical protein
MFDLPESLLDSAVTFPFPADIPGYIRPLIKVFLVTEKPGSKADGTGSAKALASSTRDLLPRELRLRDRDVTPVDGRIDKCDQQT